jgi:hypothetical protein
MAIARVVSFEGVSADRAEELRGQIQGEPPEGVPAREIVFLHDGEGGKGLVILFFDSEEDYARGDEALNAMPAGDTPGRRASVGKYDVVARMSA